MLKTHLDSNIVEKKEQLKPDAFVNEVLGSLAQPKRGVENYIGKTKKNEFHLRKAQTQIIQSTKYFLSNNFVRHAVWGSWVQPNKIIQALDFAIPPSNNMWLEWDENFRKEEIFKVFTKYLDGYFDKEMDKDTLTMGYHITKVSHNPFDFHPTTRQPDFESIEQGIKDFSRYNFQGYAKDPEGNVLILPIQFDLYNHQIDCTVLSKRKFREEFIKSGLNLWGDGYLHYWQEKGHNIEKLSCRTCLQMDNLTFLTMSPEMISHIQGGELTETFSTVLRGDLRFLISVFTLLNYSIVSHETVAPKQQIDAIRWGRKLPKNEYKVLDIDLPKPRGLRMYEPLFTGHGTPKRQHIRRGHPRRVKKLDGTIETKWIEEQVVGNPDLGTIIKDYNLRAKY